MRACSLLLVSSVCLPAAESVRVEPRMLSIHPFAGQRGSTFTATVRGSGLGGASAVIGDAAPFEIMVEKVEPESSEAGGGRNKVPLERVSLRITVRENARPGRYPVRMIARNGLSNALSLHVVDSAVTPEPPGVHDGKESAAPVPSVPVTISGRLSSRGESDLYSFQASAGQTLTFAVISGFPQPAAGGSAATVPNFDPALTLFEADASWFDPNRLKRIAFNDEPVWLYGRPTDAHLVHRFAKPGAYFLRVDAFAGQGGADYSYQLRIADGSLPQEMPAEEKQWEERSYERRLDGNRLNQLAARGGKPADQKAVETYRGAAETAAITLPANLEGALERPGETHRGRFRVEAPVDLALEVETPDTAPPFFNPIVRLLNSSGEEVATNVFAGKGACTGTMTKSLQAKTILPLRDPGEYSVEIRDATSELGGPRFRYRLQVRPQVPHVGRVRIDTDVVNLAPGEAKMVRAVFDREEDYRGALAVAAESLPPGVRATVGADYEPDTDPPLEAGKRERYVPRTEKVVVVLAAGADAEPTVRPREVELVARPLVDGKLGEVLYRKVLPVMVVAKP